MQLYHLTGPCWSQGLGESEKRGVPWRLPHDRALVTFERKLMPLADFLWFCATSKGLAEVEMTDHVLTQKTYPQASPPTRFNSVDVFHSSRES